MQNPVSGAEVQWFINGKYAASGNEYTKKEVKATFIVQAKYMKDGKALAKSEVEAVNVKTDFFTRLIAFVRGLFCRLLVIVQEYIGEEIIR